MLIRDPEKNFEALWSTFHNRYPFFETRTVDWQKQYERYRPLISADTSDKRLFKILSQMLQPLNDGHVELIAKFKGKKHYFNPEKKPRFWEEFAPREIDQLFRTTAKTLVRSGFDKPARTRAATLRYCRSADYGYIRVLELEGVPDRTLASAMKHISRDFSQLRGFILDIRNCPGGDDSSVMTILDRFCSKKTTAYRRRTKKGPGDKDFGPLKTWYMEPKGREHFTGPIVLLTCDSVFSGGECFALAARELPNVTIIGDHTNGIFSYQLEKRLPNGWKYRLSYQEYLSADGICYEGKGVPADVEVLNTKADLKSDIDPLITTALETLRSHSPASARVGP